MGVYVWHVWGYWPSKVNLVWHCISFPTMKVFRNEEASFWKVCSFSIGVFTKCFQNEEYLFFALRDYFAPHQFGCRVWILNSYDPIQLSWGRPKLSHFMFADDISYFICWCWSCRSDGNNANLFGFIMDV